MMVPIISLLTIVLHNRQWESETSILEQSKMEALRCRGILSLCTHDYSVGCSRLCERGDGASVTDALRQGGTT